MEQRCHHGFLRSAVPEVTYACVTCGGPQTLDRDHALALLKLCLDCGRKRYAAGKKAQRTTPPTAASNREK